MAYFLSFILLLSLFFVTPANASKTYRVKKGDTLYSIAKKFDVSVSFLKEANRLRASTIKPGTELVVSQKKTPAKKLKTAGKKEIQSTRRAADAAVEAEKGYEEAYHTVQKGDTLYSIARQHSLTLEELIKLNGVRTDMLQPGHRLIVKRVEKAIPESHDKEITQDLGGQATYYQVKKGDNLLKVARKFNTDVDTLKELNDLRSNSITQGQKLIVGCGNQQCSTNDKPLDKPVKASTAVEVTEVSAQLEEADTEIDPAISESRESEKEDLAHMGITDRLILLAKKMLHFPYRFGGNGSFGIDCSAYVKKVYGLVGLELPRSAREQYKVGEEVEKNELNVGDLVFFRTYASFPSHVGIYLGNNLFIHASSKAKKVTINSLNAPYYLRRFVGAKRLLSNEDRARVAEEILTVK